MSQPSQFAIRPARETDVADILAMIRELAAFENLESELQVTSGLLRDGLFGPHPPASALIALVGGHPAGYAIYYTTFSSFTGRPGLFLDDVYVRPPYRKQGIGHALMREVAQAGVERHCKRYEWIALRWNENALNIYNELGARTLEEWVLLRMNEGQLRELASGKPATGTTV